MFRFLNSSLLARAGLAMGIITVLAIAGMASAVYVARSTHGEAGAVNLAGSLRMLSYRIAATLEGAVNTAQDRSGTLDELVREFEQRLDSKPLVSMIFDTNRNDLEQAYTKVRHDWYQTIRPAVGIYRQQLDTPYPFEQRRDASRRFQQLVDDYVADIDKMVYLLEVDAESSIHMLGLMQGISLLLTLLVAVLTLYLLNMDVLYPLSELLNSAERAGQGDFTVRVGHTAEDELGRLGLAFNTMAEDLSKLYGALEERVEEKTAELTQRNRSLELLYKASQRLTVTPVEDATYEELLDEINGVLDSKGITLCLKEKDKQHAYTIANIGPTPPMCQTQRCGLCLSNDGKTRLLRGVEHDCNDDLLSIAVKDEEHEYGVMLVTFQHADPVQAWQTQVLETLGKNIGVSIGVTRRVMQRRRLALLDERSVIARELHDSLAQSLSYLKIQVTRLQVLRQNQVNGPDLDGVIDELKEGLDGAYRQLRELLTTFRLQMDGRGLGTALTETVAEFNARGTVQITLDNQIMGDCLSVNEEIHLLQIIREALANVLHHSNATRATVNISSLDDERVKLSVEDNGIGLPGQSERTNHYGLAIMQERANTLDSKLILEPGMEGGTRVSLVFRPKSVRRKPSSLQQVVL